MTNARRLVNHFVSIKYMVLNMRYSLLYNTRIGLKGGFCRADIDLQGWYESLSHPSGNSSDIFTT